MRLRPAITLFACFLSLPATAQEQLAVIGSEACVQPPCETRSGVTSRPRLIAEPKPNPFTDASTAADVPAPSPLEDDPLARFHFFHNERVHALRQRAWRNLFANPVYLFHFWYTSRKGITLLHFRNGRLRVGVETQRVLVPGESRGYANRLGAIDACPSVPGYQGGICRPIYFREGERRYAITFRWNLKQQARPTTIGLR